MSQSIYALSAVQVSNGSVPSTGRVFSFPLTLTGVSVAFDLKSLVNLHRIDNVQGIFADNSAGTAALTISTLAGDNVIIPAGSQCLMPLYLSADNVITFTGNGTIKCALLNFPTPAAVWSATASSATIIGGLLQVQDAAAETSLASIATGIPPYVYTPLGYSQLSVSGTATGLSPPTGAKYAFLTVESGNIRYRDDGTAPTASIGMPVSTGQQLIYQANLSAIQIISQSGTAIVDISYYK